MLVLVLIEATVNHSMVQLPGFGAGQVATVRIATGAYLAFAAAPLLGFGAGLLSIGRASASVNGAQPARR